MTSGQHPSQPRPSLSVVIGSRARESPSSLCLAAMTEQRRDGVEVILVEDEPAATAVPDWVVRVSRPGGLVPELWAEGLRHASGDLIALTATTVVPDPDWIERTLRAHESGAAGVGGPIEPSPGLRMVDWAAYFCRYAPYMLPIVDGEALEVAADNVSYRGEVLRRYSDLYELGFWEPFVHHAMRGDGHELRVGSERIVRQAPGMSGTRFCRQRFAHGKANGKRRSTGCSRRRILQESLTAPLVPALMTVRVARSVFAKGRLRWRFIATAPMILVFYSAWAAGELAGRLSAARSGGAG